MPDNDVDSTRVLLARAARGESTAANQVCERYLPALKRWARGRLPAVARDQVDTDDLVQETLMHAMGKLDRFEPEHSGAFQGYVRKAVLNRIRDQLRRVQRRPDLDATLTQIADGQASPLEQAIGAEMLARYESALMRLDPRVQEAVIGRLELGHTFQEVADLVDYPSADAARMAVSRALVRLAEEMSAG